MMMPHPLIPVSLPPASVTMAMSQMNHLSTIANMAAAAQGQSLPSRMVTSVIKVTFKRENSDCSPVCASWSWIFIWVVGFVVAGVAGACAGQSLPCPFFRRPQEAWQSPVIPPEQQCVQLTGPHRKLLRQDT